MTTIANGQSGGAYYADTSLHSGSWTCLYPLEDTVLASYAGNVTGLAGVTLPAGIPVFGFFSSFTLTSGGLIAYNVTA